MWRVPSVACRSQALSLDISTVKPFLMTKNGSPRALELETAENLTVCWLRWAHRTLGGALLGWNRRMYTVTH